MDALEWFEEQNIFPANCDAPRIFENEPTGVAERFKSKRSHINLNPADRVAENIFLSTFAGHETPRKKAMLAWICVIGHEIGHVVLNDRCFDRGLSPSESMNQALVAGISPHELDGASDHLCESVAESFCDLKSIETVRLYLGTQWEDYARLLANLRVADSNREEPATDEYFTAPAIMAFLSNGGAADLSGPLLETVLRHPSARVSPPENRPSIISSLSSFFGKKRRSASQERDEPSSSTWTERILAYREEASVYQHLESTDRSFSRKNSP